MKKILPTLVFISVVVVWCSFQAYSDYSWSEKVIRAGKAEGWVPAASTDKFVDILRPWTLISAPITRLAFIKPSHFFMHNSMVSTPVMFFDYNYSDGEKYTIGLNAFDQMGKMAYIKEDPQTKKFDFTNIEWHSFPPESIAGKLIKRVQTLRLFGEFQNPYPISVEANEETIYKWYSTSGIKWSTYGEKGEQDQYVGPVKNSKPNGIGVMNFARGSKYEGEWKDGFEHGQGTYTFPNGSEYVGEWKEGKPWNVTGHDKGGNIIKKWIKGEKKSI